MNNRIEKLNKSYEINGNVYSLTIGNMDSRELYLFQLEQEISSLKSKLNHHDYNIAEDEKTNRENHYRTLQTRTGRKRYEEEQVKSNERKLKSGRIYTRLLTPSSINS